MTTLEQLSGVIRDVQDRSRERGLSEPSESDLMLFYEQGKRNAPLAPPSESVWAALSPARLGSILRDHFRGLALAGALAGAAAGAVVLLYPSSDGLEFTVAGDTGSVGQWLSTEQQPLPLEFSDGTVVTLTEKTRARVTHNEHEAAEFAIDRGRLELNVVPNKAHRWSVAAGPFAVVVHGTVFSVSWEPGGQQLEVQVSRGEVAVDGPLLNSEVRLTAGRRLVASLKRGEAQISEVSDGATADAVPERANNALPEVTQLVEDGLEAPHKRAAVRKTAPAPAAALGADELMQQADAARASGNTARAMELLQQIRAEYPASSQARLAAYTLGVTAFVQQRSHRTAARWFSVYLSEVRSGPLVRDALGQLMEAQEYGGQRAQAKDSAKRYLQKYPSGPHSQFARRLLAE